METATFANRKFIVYTMVYMFGCAALYFMRRKRHSVLQNTSVLQNDKCITKHQYSSDLWPLKIMKRNCIVDKSLAVRTLLLRNHSRYVCPCICNAKWRNKDKNTTVRFSVRNCTHGCQMYYSTAVF
jgi:hypothetical protein